MLMLAIVVVASMKLTVLAMKFLLVMLIEKILIKVSAFNLCSKPFLYFKMFEMNPYHHLRLQNVDIENRLHEI